jgi:hypothetical protein
VNKRKQVFSNMAVNIKQNDIELKSKFKKEGKLTLETG